MPLYTCCFSLVVFDTLTRDKISYHGRDPCRNGRGYTPSKTFDCCPISSSWAAWALYLLHNLNELNRWPKSLSDDKAKFHAPSPARKTSVASSALCFDTDPSLPSDAPIRRSYYTPSVLHGLAISLTQEAATCNWVRYSARTTAEVLPECQRHLGPLLVFIKSSPINPSLF